MDLPPLVAPSSRSTASLIKPILAVNFRERLIKAFEGYSQARVIMIKGKKTIVATIFLVVKIKMNGVNDFYFKRTFS